MSLMQIWISFFSMMVSIPMAVAGPESTFYASESVQRQMPEAFVLQPEAEPFLRALDGETIVLRTRFVEVIRQDLELHSAILRWESLSIEQQLPHLRRVFDLLIGVMGIQAPELILDGQTIPGRAAFFEFDVHHPGPGRVILNPEVLKSMDKFASLALLIHETRHSAQFQQAFSPEATTSFSAIAYRAAFTAQQTLKIQSFCDFLTLANEFEAFQFGNYVLGKLTRWSVDMPDMGTLASQYDATGTLKLDLLQLIEIKTGTLLENFNLASEPQCRQLGACPQP